MTSFTEIKQAIDQTAEAFEEFKKTNDQILERKADGKAVAELEEKLDKINEKIDQAVEIKSRMDAEVQENSLIGREEITLWLNSKLEGRLPAEIIRDTATGK